ncbi:MAG: ATP-binding cassette domain-containing protein [Candidatus Omnitrophica bacterium]|nr:ATP-binding cassette domain-containing protein [Candidatus Omnitrophota bacterium]
MITIRNVSMRYGAYTALDRVSFSVNRGEILGLLGPNGAGKTTLMRVVTTYLYPSEGTVEVAGHDVLKDPMGVRRCLGYLPETAPLYFGMQVEEYLIFLANVRGVDANRLRERLDFVKKACGLKLVWKHTLSELSKGYRQRVGLAQALIHDPDVLILDEPTSGLDPLQILDIRALIRSLAQQKTIVFSTHILQEVEALADRIVIINNARIVADGTREEITQKALKGQRVRLAVQANQQEVQEALQSLNVCEEVRYLGVFGSGVHQFLLRAGSGKPLIRLVDEAVKSHRWPLFQLAEETADLEEAFLALLRGSKAAP